MDNLLNALGENVKPRGRNWTARCPVHNDKDFAMSIKQIEDGSVVAHCHACGANGLELYQALDLDLEELFGHRKLERQNNYIPEGVKDLLSIDRIAVRIFDRLTEQGNDPTLADKKRYKLAKARIIGVEQKYNIN